MKQGFTLIELIVVVLIIGILSAIAMPQYTQAVEKARVSEALAMLNAIQKGVDIWVMENGYPTTSTELIGTSAGDHLTRKLIIDSENALSCGGDRCSGQFFTYDAYCYSTGCSINAYSTTKASYKLYMIKSKDTRKWTKSYQYTNDLGHAICDQLAGQGWVEKTS